MTEYSNPGSYQAEEHPKKKNTFYSLRAGVESIKNNAISLIDAGKVISRLSPKQVKDELQIAKLELKEKGIAVGKGAAVIAVGLLFGLFLLIALVSAGILALGKVVEPWIAALILAAVFLIILAICALVGLKMIKAQLPFKPESAIFGILYDLGVLKHGSAMTAQRLKDEQAQKAAEKKVAETSDSSTASEKAPAPTIADYKKRTEQRREHLKSLRDDVDAYSTTVQNQAQSLVATAKRGAKDAPTQAADASRRLVANATSPKIVQSRWKSFTALLASLGAFLLFLGKLIKKR